MISVDQVRERLTYDDETGLLYWRTRGGKGSHVGVGDVAGGMHQTGYTTVKLCGKHCMAHRLAWCLYYGEWPTMEIDHINGDRNDNRICNLRHVTRSQNQRNRHYHRNGHLVGTSYSKRDKTWQSFKHFGKKKVSFGAFSTQIEAHRAFRTHMFRAKNAAGGA